MRMSNCTFASVWDATGLCRLMHTEQCSAALPATYELLIQLDGCSDEYMPLHAPENTSCKWVPVRMLQSSGPPYRYCPSNQVRT